MQHQKRQHQVPEQQPVLRQKQQHQVPEQQREREPEQRQVPVREQVLLLSYHKQPKRRRQ